MKLWWAVPPPCMSVVLVNSSLSHPLRVSFIYTHVSCCILVFSCFLSLSLFSGILGFKANTLWRLKAVCCRLDGKDYDISKFSLIFFCILFCAFEVVVPKLKVLDLRSVAVFKNKLKTHLFLLAFVYYYYY